MNASISVIIPAYNVAEYIGEALKSVLLQSPPFHRIIVIDDGSTDGTRDIISRFDDPRVTYHAHENRGLGPSRNVGIDLADTEFIYLMDGDDVLQPGLTKAFLAAIEESPNLDAFVFSGVDFLHENPNATQKSSKYYERRLTGTYENGRDFVLRALTKGNFPDLVWLYIFRRSILDKQPKLRFQKILYEDTLFTAPLLLKCGEIRVSNEIFYRRRVRHSSIMTSPPSIMNVISYLKIACWWKNLAATHDSHANRAITLRSHHFYSHAIRSARRAKISLSQMQSLVQEHAETFRSTTTVDFIVSKLSKKMVAKLIDFRARTSLRLK